MASILLQVLLLGVIAAASNDVPVTWVAGPRVALPCDAGAGSVNVRTRRPPPPLNGDEWTRATPRHAWWREDVEINATRILPNGTLEISRRWDGDGVYRCSVRLDAGIVVGHPIHIKFATIEKEFSLSPGNVTASVGQPTALSCQIRSGPPATITWLKGAQPLPENERYHVLSNQLLIMDTKREDSGLYNCVAKNTVLNKSRVSLAGRLEVQDGGYLQPGFVALELETNITAPRGSRVKLPCPVVGWPRPRLTWHMTPPGGRTGELEFTDEVLLLSSLEYDQEGVYTCTVEEDISLVKIFNVTITEAVTISIPPTSKEALRAGTVRFNCTAEGKPAPNITWYKDGQQLIMAGRINLRQSTNGKRTELVISGLTSDDAGIYQCFASNSHSMASAWTTLNVTGADAAAPGAVRCRPEGARSVRVSWTPPAAQRVVAYTVHATPQVTELGRSLPGLPHTNTEELVDLKQPLTPYSFQVRAYIQPTGNNKNVASDLSESVTCQGQGVPIKLVKLNEDSVLVSWKQFAGENPDVVSWMLQYRQENGSQEHNVTLDQSVFNYTMNVSPASPLQIRVLGTKTLPWLDQDLSMVPWASTAAAGDFLDGDEPPTPQDLKATYIGAREITVTWRGDDASTERYVYVVCVRKMDGSDECKETVKSTVTFSGLQPGSPVEVRARARVPGRGVAGAFSGPLALTTRPEGSQRFANLTSQYVNTSALRVSWGSDPAQYTVHYSAQLKLPVEQWNSIKTWGNTVLITGIDPTEMTYIMVTGYNPLEHSKIETIQPLQDLEPKDLHYEHTDSGVRIWWTGSLGPRMVSYAQNITKPVEQWRNVNADTAAVELTDLDPHLPTFVMVTAGKKRRSQVLSIQPRPQHAKYPILYIGLGIAIGVVILVVLALAAVFIWRKRKQVRSPVRSRRRMASASDGNEEEGSEMKNIGGRLANGVGSKEAGEPLLNGHVHITENPTSKTPNGKMRKPCRYEPAFDVSRHEDPDTTFETVLDSETSFNLLDTSRRPDNSRSRDNISTNNSFTKLPDDNMNSELTSTFELDDSKIQPTLQPNG